MKYKLGTLALAIAIALVPTSIGAKRVKPPGPTAGTDEARAYFKEDPDAPRHAPKGYDVTVVIYTDYQCPYCRKQTADLMKLVKTDPKVRILFRDWPLLGEGSRKAARVAIAAKYQGKYLAAHQALMKAPRPLDDANIKAAVVHAGINWNWLQADLKSHAVDIDDLIERNDDQGNMLGFTGTPGFIVGNSQSFGAMSFAELVQAIKDERAKKKGLPTTIRKSRKK